MFKRVAIVNRGAAAMRLIQAVGEIRDEAGRRPITIALHTENERHARFVRAADESWLIGGAANPYLDDVELKRALVASEADAAWVGSGVTAEHPDFAELCDHINVAFVGPPPETTRRAGDRMGCKRVAEAANVPVIPWSGGSVASLDEARHHADTLGYPLLIKTAVGRGGRGTRFVTSVERLAAGFEDARAEAFQSCGDSTVFMERLVSGARYIEIPIAADRGGTVWALGVRDRSIQQRDRTVLAESPSPALDEDLQHQITSAAIAIATALGYRNVGSIAFLYTSNDRSFAFLEVNAQLQVEHPVTECTSGCDLAKLQFQLAAGELLRGDVPTSRGHATQVHLNVHDSKQDVDAAPSMIGQLDLPQGPGIRVDTGVAAGDVMLPACEATIATITAWGRDRAESIDRLRQALRQTRLTIRSGMTNRSFLINLLDRVEVIDSTADTAWVEQITTPGEHQPTPHAGAALLMAAVDGWEADAELERTRFYAWTARGRPKSDLSASHTLDFLYCGHHYRLVVRRLSPSRFRAEVDGAVIDVEIERLSRLESRVVVGRRRFHVLSGIDGPDHLVEVDDVAHRILRDEGGVIRAPAPALVVSVTAQIGDQVDPSTPLVVLESMKMETILKAPYAARVREIMVGPNMQVDAGLPLVRLHPVGSTPSADLGPRVAFTAWSDQMPPAASAHTRCRDHLAAMRWQVLGFDATPDEISRTIDGYGQARVEVKSDDENLDLLRAELVVLTAFADITSLSRNRYAGEADPEEVHRPEQHFHRYLRSLDVTAEGLPPSFRAGLQRALAHMDVDNLERSPQLEQAAYAIFRAQRIAAARLPIVIALLRGLAQPLHQISTDLRGEVRGVLDRLIAATELRHPVVGDLARNLRFRTFDEPIIEAGRRDVMVAMHRHLEHLTAEGERADREAHIAALVGCPYPLFELRVARAPGGSFTGWTPLLEVLTRRNYIVRHLTNIESVDVSQHPVLLARYRRQEDGRRHHVVATLSGSADLVGALKAVAHTATQIPDLDRIVADVYIRRDAAPSADANAESDGLAALVRDAALPTALDRLAFSLAGADVPTRYFTFRRANGGWDEDRPVRGLHPLIAFRLHLWRLREHFDIERLPSAVDTHVFRAVARGNPRDERLMAAAEVRDLTPIRNQDGSVTALPELERVLTVCLDGLRQAQASRAPHQRWHWNRLLLFIWPDMGCSLDELRDVTARLWPLTVGLGLEEVRFRGRFPNEDGSLRDAVLRLSQQPGTGVVVRMDHLPTTSLQPLDDYTGKVVASRRRGAPYPYELLSAITGDAGRFGEYDMHRDGAFGPVERPRGRNTAGIVVGLVVTPTTRYPEGMSRVVLIGDPTKALGSIAEPECRRIIGALDLAEAMGIPVEWFALSAGARIAMDSGTENMDWVSRVLRRIIEFTQGGGEINVIVTGINVGAQPYWNAEATMLMHTKGILVMTPDSAMVLTGKQALDYSGGVSAEDNFGIGGYDRIMGPNGQAQYWAPDLAGACALLFRHYEHAYRAPGERFARRAATTDPLDRDIRLFPHPVDGFDFTTVGDIFSDAANPDRKKPFDIRAVMRATLDLDHEPLERWPNMQDAESVVVFDAHLGGWPVTMLGIESRSMPRHGPLPADGPDRWTAGTLFPLSSKKAARAINAASGSRALVVLANLSGFDGSPESLRRRQLEYGAEIGRAIVNFAGPIVFCVVSRYHGGAFVVFSSALHDNLQVFAVEGTYASVLGGAPAAAVVFTSEVGKRTRADQRVAGLEAAIGKAAGSERAALRARLAEVTEAVRSEKLGEVAAEFDAIHTVERARDVGSVHEIIPAVRLRPALIEAVNKGLSRATGSAGGGRRTRT